MLGGDWLVPCQGRAAEPTAFERLLPAALRNCPVTRRPRDLLPLKMPRGPVENDKSADVSSPAFGALAGTAIAEAGFVREGCEHLKRLRLGHRRRERDGARQLPSMHAWWSPATPAQAKIQLPLRR